MAAWPHGKHFVVWISMQIIHMSLRGWLSLQRTSFAHEILPQALRDLLFQAVMCLWTNLQFAWCLGIRVLTNTRYTVSKHVLGRDL